MKRYALLLLIVLTGLYAHADDMKMITFPSLDGLEITAELYMAHDKQAPFVVLFHQADWSRGAYREIAPRLNVLGFNALAVDQRSGGSVNDIPNETVMRATRAGLKTGFVDALPDLEAALIFARENYAQGQLLGWGSSYSAGLTLKLAGDRPELIDGALAFSPGEYFARFGKTETWIQDSARAIQVPAFITSAGHEQANWHAIYEVIPAEAKAAFVPSSNGNHGSRALWSQFEDSEAYWQALTAFLDANFPR